VERSFALSAEENLLFSLVSRPRGKKAKSQPGTDAQEEEQQEELQQAETIYQEQQAFPQP